MHIWEWLATRYRLSASQLDVLKRYVSLIQSATSNVTALRTEEEIIYYHFADSLELTCALPQDTTQNPSCILDVGSGAGLPGIPLAIVYPGSTVILLEVVGKKRQFLQHTIAELGLTNILVDGTDWLTYMRTTRQPVDLVCARASLVPAELLRMYSKGSKLTRATLVYWASEKWVPTEPEKAHIVQTHTYTIGDRTRQLVLFAG